MTTPLNPSHDLPVCATCGASCVTYERTLDHKRAPEMESIAFACGGSHARSWKQNFRHDFPDGPFSTYGPSNEPWRKVSNCGNAEEVVRRLREEKKA